MTRLSYCQHCVVRLQQSGCRITAIWLANMFACAYIADPRCTFSDVSQQLPYITAHMLLYMNLSTEQVTQTSYFIVQLPHQCFVVFMTTAQRSMAVPGFGWWQSPLQGGYMFCCEGLNMAGMKRKLVDHEVVSKKAEGGFDPAMQCMAILTCCQNYVADLQHNGVLFTAI